MTISSTTTKNLYNGDGSTTIFAYTFEILKNADVLVQTKVNSTGIITTRIINTDYTVSGAGVSTGGNITFLVAPPSGTTIIILRNAAYLQASHYPEYGPFPAVTLEQNLDLACMWAQQLNEISSRNLQFDAALPNSFNTTVPIPSGPNLYLATNSTGTGFTFTSLFSTGAYVFGAGTGLLAQTAEGNAAVRTFQGTSNQIVITNGDGVAGNLTAALASVVNQPGSINSPSVTVPSATSTPIFAAAANSVIISGTTTITSFDTYTAGAIRDVTFSGILTLTYNATSLVIPGAASITTAAGDTAVVQSLGSGNSRILFYQKATGHSIVGGNLTAVVQLITSTGTYVPTANTLFKIVAGVGPGGAGAGASASGNNSGGGGGGGGGYFQKLLSQAQCTSGAVVIGTAGVGNTSTGTGGSATTFTCTGAGSIVLTANNGSNGATYAGTTGGANGGAGGTATGGDINLTGENGGPSASFISTTAGFSGRGGGSILGTGTASVYGAQTTTTAGTSGNNYGSGGSGALINGSASANGGNGGASAVIITDYILS